MGIISNLNRFDWGIIPRFDFLIFKEFIRRFLTVILLLSLIACSDETRNGLYSTSIKTNSAQENSCIIPNIINPVIPPIIQ